MPIKYKTIGRLEIRLSDTLTTYRMGTKRIWNLKNVRFNCVTNDKKELLVNKPPEGLYIHVDDIIKFINDNLKGNLI